MKGVGHVARMGERISLKERDHLDNVGVDGRILFKYDFNM
jgi:hypothetical protein